MAKGNVAKVNLMNKIIAALGNDYIGEFDKKHYFLSEENGEMIQVAISMTCPKVPIETGAVSAPKVTESNVLNFEEMPSPEVKITDEEKKNIAELMARLGL